MRGLVVALVVLCGFGLVAYGVSMFSPAAGVITAGVLLVVYAVIALADVGPRATGGDQ